MSWNDLRAGRYSQPYGEYFITFNTHKRTPFFNNFHTAKLFCQQISFHEEQHQCCWLAWVLMPDHFHGILRLNDINTDLSKTIAALKGSSAYLINKKLNRKEQVWQPAFFDRALRKEEDRLQIARYIVANPLRGNIVSDLGCYPFWNSVYL